MSDIKYNKALFDAFFERLIADCDRVIAAQPTFPAELPACASSISDEGAHRPVGWVDEDGGWIPQTKEIL